MASREETYGWCLAISSAAGFSELKSTLPVSVSLHFKQVAIPLKTETTYFLCKFKKPTSDRSLCWLRPQSPNYNIYNRSKHELTPKNYHFFSDNNWSKPRNSWYTLSNPLIFHSLKILCPHSSGDDSLLFQSIISIEQKLPCTSLSSHRIYLLLSLLLSKHFQYLHNFLWSLLHL